jgi:hypothetical protein
LRNGGRPWLRFEASQFGHLGAFKKFPSQTREFESLVKLPVDVRFEAGQFATFAVFKKFSSQFVEFESIRMLNSPRSMQNDSEFH